MNIKDELKEQIKKHALRDPQKECCGFIILPERSFDLEVFECSNVAERPSHFFTIKPLDFLEASKKGKIKAIYHSHINDNEEFSENDKLNSKKHKIDYLLYNNIKDSFYHFGYKGNSIADMTKPFKWGINDCFTNVRDYIYKHTKTNILLPDWYINHDDLWQEKHPNVIREVLDLNPILKRVEYNNASSLKKYDILCFALFKKNKVEDHFGVYVGEERFFHLPLNKFPIIEDMGAFFKNKISSVYRIS